MHFIDHPIGETNSQMFRKVLTSPGSYTGWLNAYREWLLISIWVEKFNLFIRRKKKKQKKKTNTRVSTNPTDP